MSYHKHRASSHSSKSYEICENTDDLEFSEYEDYNQHLMGGLLDYMNELKKKKLKKIKKRQEIVKEDSSYDLTDLAYDIDDEEESLACRDKERKKRSIREKHYVLEEQKHIQGVHKELCDINEKLQNENTRLREWNSELEDREEHLNNVEKELADYAASIQEMVEKEVQRRCEGTEKSCEIKIQQIQDEGRKTRSAFKILKKSNETLKKQTESDAVKLKAYEERKLALQNRIANLQRKNEILQQQLNDTTHTNTFQQTVKEKTENVSCKKKEAALQANMTAMYEVFSTLLQWLSEVHLKQTVYKMMKNDSSLLLTNHQTLNEENTNERCMKILISFPHILQDILLMSDNVQLSFVSFIYWSLLHAHLTQSSQRFTHSTTYRRIGEELFSARASNNKKQINTNRTFFESKNIRIRLLSSLVVLHTVCRADIMAQSFQSLSSDLRFEQSKAVFVENYGVVLLLPLFKLTNKVRRSNAICDALQEKGTSQDVGVKNQVHLILTTDILMLLTAESPYLQNFLLGLSCVEWIQAIISIMKSCQDDIPLMEKLSLLLQRLSKIKSNKSIFDALQVYNVISEIQRTLDPTEEFLKLNLRSILFNIDAMKSSK